MQIQPLHDRVLVKRIEEEERMESGLYIPESAKEKPQRGEVVAVGKGKRAEEGRRHELDVRVGDQVLFGEYCGTDISLNGNAYLILREDEIFGVVDGDDSDRLHMIRYMEDVRAALKEQAPGEDT